MDFPQDFLLDFRQETNEDTGGPDDQVIPLSSLPEPVAARYYHVRRKMEKMKDKASEKIEDMKRQKLIESGIGALEPPGPVKEEGKRAVGVASDHSKSQLRMENR